MSKISVKIDTSTPQGLRQYREALGLSLDAVVLRARELDPEAGTGDATWLSRAERGYRTITEAQRAAIIQAIEDLAKEVAREG